MTMLKSTCLTLTALLAVTLLSHTTTVQAAGRINEFQYKGSHNSFHVAPTTKATLPEWDYTYESLTNQVTKYGVRSFEFDVSFDATSGKYNVIHVAKYDTGTTCATMTLCLTELKNAVTAQTEPIFVLIQMNTPLNSAGWDAFETMVASVWGSANMITPAEVKGSASSMSAALKTGTAWPLLSDSLGKMLMFTNSPYSGHVAGSNRITFTGYSSQSDLTNSNAAVFVYNDPKTLGTAINTAVNNGALVRTRADTLYRRVAPTIESIQAGYLATIDVDGDGKATKEEIETFSVSLTGNSIPSTIMDRLMELCGKASPGTISQPSEAGCVNDSIPFMPSPHQFEDISEAYQALGRAIDSGAHLIFTDEPHSRTGSSAPSDREYYVQLGETTTQGAACKKGVSACATDYPRAASQPTPAPTAGGGAGMVSMNIMSVVMTGLIACLLTL